MSDREGESRIHELISEYEALQRDFDLAIKTEDHNWQERLQEHKKLLLNEIRQLDPSWSEEADRKAA